MNIKFGVFWKQNLGTIYKDNSITTLGKEADVDLSLSEVSSIHANFKVDGKNYTSIVYIVDIEKGLIRIPFTREVLSIGMHELELVAVMKNGDVIPSQTFTYNIVESLDNLEDITEETNYPILIQLLQDVNSKIAEIDDAIARIPSPEELKGEKGDKGDKGEQGIQGERGLQGIQGVRGEKGDKGDRGLQGIQGVKGEKGDKGERGERGLQGIQGNQGARGIQGEKGDKGETGVGLGFEWSGTKLGIKKDTDISYKYVELKGAKGEQGAKGEKGDTPSITHLETQIANKSKELDTKFNTLTAKQQQDAEVVTARDGEVSLHARLERDLAKGKIHFVDVEGSSISTESEEGYLENVEILGNTWQDANNLSDIRSVGTKVEGQELYEIPVLSYGKNLLNINSSGTYYGVTFSLEKNVLSVKGTGTVSILKKYSIKHLVEEGRTYVLTSKSKNSNVGIIDGNSVTSIGGAFVAGNDVCIYFQIREGVFVNETIELQLEEGTVATPYEPYKEDKLTILSHTPLEKVGDVADRIICKDGVWGVEKNIGTTELNGSENWKHLLPTDSYNKAVLDVNNYMPLDNTSFDVYPLISTKFEVVAPRLRAQDNAQITCASWDNITQMFLNIPCDENTKDLNSFKEYLRNNNITVKHIYEQPIFIPLPHDQQVKLKTFAEHTHISFDTEIQPTIKAQVPKSLGATVNTHTTQIDNLNKELDRVKKLEESTVSTVTSDKAFTTVSETNNGYFEDVKIEGKTLVNLCPNKPYESVGNGSSAVGIRRKLLKDIEGGKPYTICYTVSSDTDASVALIAFYNVNGTNSGTVFHGDISEIKGTTQIQLITLKNTLENANFGCYVMAGSPAGSKCNIYNVIILEGDHTDKDITFFEGLKSVGQDTDEISVSSVNENLFDLNKVHSDKISIIDNNIIITNSYATDIGLTPRQLGLIANKQYIISRTFKGEVPDGYATGRVALFGEDGSTKSLCNYNAETNSFTLTSKELDFKFALYGYANSVITFTDMYIGLDIPSSKPCIHKSNKKPLLYYNPTTQTWEKPVLREWDSIEKHSDGKYYYHKRSGEVVLNGSSDEPIGVRDNLNNTIGFTIRIGDEAGSLGKVLSDKFSYKSLDVSNDSDEFTRIITPSGGSCLYFKINKSKLSTQDVAGFKSWLQANNVTVVYQLAQEEVYECANLDLITYPNETNLIVNSGAIQPKLELKVHSNISNVVKLLQEKVSVLENKFIEGLKQVLAGDMMSLAHLLYPEDFENNHEIQTLEL